MGQLWVEQGGGQTGRRAEQQRLQPGGQGHGPGKPDRTQTKAIMVEKNKRSQRTRRQGLRGLV